jgi:hypothetical protein
VFLGVFSKSGISDPLTIGIRSTRISVSFGCFQDPDYYARVGDRIRLRRAKSRLNSYF